MYSISGYGSMIADRVRIDAYAKALRQAVSPGAVVIDIGTGTGFFAMLACQFGARRVYAVEPDDSIQLAREAAAANGYADRIEFIQDYSTAVSLPERADVIISDMRDLLPLFHRHIPSIVDARTRLLKEGGALIPREDRVWVALAEHGELYERLSAPWLSSPYGLDLSAGWRVLTSAWRKAGVAPEQLLVEPRHWATLDYATIERADFAADLSWKAERAGTAHGLVAWFDAVLGEGVEFSNAPGLPELIYGRSFLPYPEPVALAEGDEVSLRMRADLVGGDYVWSWETTVSESGGAGRVKAGFRQSTLTSALLSPERLRKQSSVFVPALGEEGELDLFVLGLMDGGTPLEGIARRLAERAPSRFKSWHEALTRAGAMSLKYSR